MAAWALDDLHAPSVEDIDAISADGLSVDDLSDLCEMWKVSL